MKITTCSDIGKYVKERRKEMGYTQLELSEETGLSVSFISDVEKGKVTAEIGKVLTLVKLLGMDLLIEERK